MDMETECTSGSRANLSPVSGTWPMSPSENGPSPIETGPGPAPETEFSPGDLTDWYPRYLGCVRFFLAQSQHTPAVQSLAAFLNIRLPCQRLSASAASPGDASGVSPRPYIRRLIVTGQDTPSNLQMFFGDDWAAGVGCLCKQERLNYLFAAKSGGWASTKTAYDILPDEQTPFLRPLREPTEEELRVADSRWSEWLAMEDWMLGPRRPW
ncbi:uncharacterized protein CDV56_109420 [Aspergillus thermomutatus]|uniref:Uncharacterized protein n=1 Tax=Aspergillus thermomutatus TaxID=41047 RepID=A0A397HQB5_ASPTH|nr:uncharacterized protein CDV56_109420 [Aspergillus thermomutatus]RHZ65361.1 hypothetical protein CDV56_109420 [Aspergillus thermomutatus]